MFRLDAHHEAHVTWVPFAAVGGAVLASFLAYYMYVAFPRSPDKVKAKVPALVDALEHKYYFDEAYDGFVKTAVVSGSDKVLWKEVDATLIDGSVNGVGRITRDLGTGVRELQTGFIRSYALVLFAGAVVFVSYLVWMR